MSARDKLTSVMQMAKQKPFAVAFAGVLLICLLTALVRDIGGAPAIRRQLIGAWELSGIIDGGVEMPVPTLPKIGRLRMTLNDDGAVDFHHPGDEKSTWYVADARHFHILREFPPNPAIPGMAEGAREDEEHEIISLTSNRLVVRQFDYESDAVWRRVDPLKPPAAR